MAVSPHQQALRLAQNLANGGALDYYLIGRLDNHQDRSGYKAIQRIFHYHAAHGEDYLGNMSKADAMLLNDSHNNDPECRGWFRFLAESHFLFDAPVTETALERPWGQYKAIVLPNIRYLSDGMAAKLDEFVANGGTLVATGLSSFADQDYEARPEPALRCLGIRRVELVKEDMRPSYLLIEDKSGFRRLAETELVYLDGPYVYCDYAETAQQHLKLVPPHKFGPPERCYYETVVDRPGFVVHPYGAGKAIYIPWLPGELFHRQGHTNTADFAADLLEHVAGLVPVSGNLSPMVEVTLFENRERAYQLLHLVNGSGHFGTTFYEPVMMRDLEVIIPYEGKPGTVYSLVAERPYSYIAGGQTLTVRAPRLDLFDAIKVVAMSKGHHDK